MKKRLGTVLLLALFVISSMMPTSAATAEIWNEARASHYFDAYMLGISAKGGGEMAVSFGVFGTDTMDKIGVYSLRIESEIAPNKWIEEFTVYGSSDPDTFYAISAIWMCVPQRDMPSRFVITTSFWPTPFTKGVGNAPFCRIAAPS